MTLELLTNLFAESGLKLPDSAQSGDLRKDPFLQWIKRESLRLLKEEGGFMPFVHQAGFDSLYKVTYDRPFPQSFLQKNEELTAAIQKKNRRSVKRPVTKLVDLYRNRYGACKIFPANARNCLVYAVTETGLTNYLNALRGTSKSPSKKGHASQIILAEPYFSTLKSPTAFSDGSTRHGYII